MMCFEINCLLVDPASEKNNRQIKDLRQYFYQPKGHAEALRNCFAWVHLKVAELKAKEPQWVIERLVLHEWRINSPEPNGDIKTCKFQKKVLNWAFDRGIIELHANLNNKQKKKAEAAVLRLNDYRPLRSLVKIEDIGSNLMDGVKCLVVGEIVTEDEDEWGHRMGWLSER